MKNEVNVGDIMAAPVGEREAAIEAAYAARRGWPACPWTADLECVMKNETFTPERIKAEADAFFEWDGEDRSLVTTTSCLLFAQHIAGLMQARSAQPAPVVQEGYVLVNVADFTRVLDRSDWRNAKNRAELRKALDAPRQPAGWKLVPERMHLDSSVIETIQAHCGDGQEDAGFGPYSDGVLWIGECEEEDGSKTYGLHIATADYPEEGSSTLVEFAAAPSTPATVQGVNAQLLEALENTATWIEQLPVPTVGAAGQLVKIDKAIAAARKGEWE